MALKTKGVAHDFTGDEMAGSPLSCSDISLSTSAMSVFVLIDEFDDLRIGNIDDQDGWVAQDSTHEPRAASIKLPRKDAPNLELIWRFGCN